MIKKIFAILLIAGLLTVSPAISVSAVSRPAAAQVPVGTLIIGTHLIYVPAMTNAVYETALLSSSDPTLNAQQNSVYYKSEFAGGRWLDISTATNIYDLSAASGKLVDDSVIDMLTLKFYTMPDSKTYDLTTGLQVAISDILSPYDAKAQPEMEPLVNFRKSLDPDNEDNDDPLLIAAEILDARYSSDYTDYLDRVIGQLNSMLNSMRDRNVPIQNQDALLQLIAKLDHRRRASGLTAMRDKVLDGLSKAGEKDLQGLITTMSPIADALEQQIQTHLAVSEESDTMDALPTDSSKARIRLEMESALLALADLGGSPEEAEKLLQDLVNMDNLDKGLVVSPELELATALDMVESLQSAFLARLTGGAIDELLSANPEDPYAFFAAEEKQEDVFESARLELQSAIGAAGERMSAKEYGELLSSLLAGVRTTEPDIPNDASKSKALGTIQSCIDWLNGEQNRIGGESAEKSEAQQLQIKINELEQQSKAALDRNDLALADTLEREIEVSAAKLSALENEASAILSSLTQSVARLESEAETAALTGDTQLAESLKAQASAAQAEIAAIEAALPASIRATQQEITQLRQDALKAVEQGEIAALTASVENITAFSEREPVAALDAIKMIDDAILKKQALFGAEGGNFDGVRALIAETLPDLQEQASNVGNTVDLQGLLELFDSRLEPLPNDISVRIAAIVEVDGGKNDKDLLNLLDEYYTQLQGGQATADQVSSGQATGAGIAFTVAVSSGTRYIPAAILPAYLNLRFLPEKNNRCLLTNGAEYYRFIRGDYVVKTHLGDWEMAQPAYYSGDAAYIPESFVSEQFGLSIVELPLRGTAILIDAAARKQADEIAAIMKGV